MPRNILLYADEKTATGSLGVALKQSFDDAGDNIIRVRADDLRQGILRDAQSRLFILPGITGEDSPYTAQLDQAILRELHDFVSLKPNAMLTLCAGTYFTARDTVYDTGHPPIRRKTSLAPFFNGLAKGPVAPYGRPAETHSAFGDVVVVPVQFKNAEGQWEDARSCYGNGPALYPDDPDDPSIEIIARYADIQDRPIAMLRQSCGRGAVYMSCILPEIGYSYIAPRRKMDNACTLMEDLKPHEAGRKKLWDTLITRIQQDLAP